MGVEPTSPVDQPSVGAQGWHLCRSAKGTLAEGEGVEPPRLALDCFQDSCRRQSACPPIEAAVAGVEPAIVSLTGSRLTVRPHRNESVRAAGFEPAFSCARGRRNPRLSHALIAKSTQRESNPHIRHGKAAGSRYIMGAKNRTKLSKIESTGWDSNPRPARECSARITGAHFLAARATSAYLSVGSEGLEPSPTWVRTRHAAANTLIPSFVLPLFCARKLGAEGVEPSSDPYKRPALTVELRAGEGDRLIAASTSRAGGI